jgi:hypothetical protein
LTKVKARKTNHAALDFAEPIVLSGGSVEEHERIDSKNPKELKNLADWILQQLREPLY